MLRQTDRTGQGTIDTIYAFRRWTMSASVTNLGVTVFFQNILSFRTALGLIFYYVHTSAMLYTAGCRVWGSTRGCRLPQPVCFISTTLEYWMKNREWKTACIVQYSIVTYFKSFSSKIGDYFLKSPKCGNGALNEKLKKVGKWFPERPTLRWFLERLLFSENEII